MNLPLDLLINKSRGTRSTLRVLVDFTQHSLLSSDSTTLGAIRQAVGDVVKLAYDATGAQPNNITLYAVVGTSENFRDAIEESAERIGIDMLSTYECPSDIEAYVEIDVVFRYTGSLNGLSIVRPSESYLLSLRDIRQNIDLEDEASDRLSTMLRYDFPPDINDVPMSIYDVGREVPVQFYRVAEDPELEESISSVIRYARKHDFKDLTFSLTAQGDAVIVRLGNTKMPKTVNCDRGQVNYKRVAFSIIEGLMGHPDTEIRYDHADCGTSSVIVCHITLFGSVTFSSDTRRAFNQETNFPDKARELALAGAKDALIEYIVCHLKMSNAGFNPLAYMRDTSNGCNLPNPGALVSSLEVNARDVTYKHYTQSRDVGATGDMITSPSHETNRLKDASNVVAALLYRMNLPDVEVPASDNISATALATATPLYMDPHSSILAGNPDLTKLELTMYYGTQEALDTALMSMHIKSPSDYIQVLSNNK